jgi:DNA-binding LytR/AlgR family response regulator
MNFNRKSFARIENPFFYKTEKGIMRVDLHEVVAIKSEGKYQRLITTTTDIILVSSTDALEQAIRNLPFVRIHRSWMIHLPYLSFVDRYRNYVCIGDLELPLGKNYVDLLMMSIGMKEPED